MGWNLLQEQLSSDNWTLYFRSEHTFNKIITTVTMINYMSGCYLKSKILCWSYLRVNLECCLLSSQGHFTPTAKEWLLLQSCASLTWEAYRTGVVVSLTWVAVSTMALASLTWVAFSTMAVASLTCVAFSTMVVASLTWARTVQWQVLPERRTVQGQWRVLVWGRQLLVYPLHSHVM